MTEKAYLYSILNREYNVGRTIKLTLLFLIFYIPFAQYRCGENLLRDAFNKEWDPKVDGLIDHYTTSGEITFKNFHAVLDSLYSINQNDTLRITNTRMLISDLENAHGIIVATPAVVLVFIVVFKLISSRLAPNKWNSEKKMFHASKRILDDLPMLVKKWSWFYEERSLKFVEVFKEVYKISPLQQNWKNDLRYNWFADICNHSKFEDMLYAFDVFYDKLVFCIKKEELQNQLLRILDCFSDFLFSQIILADSRLSKKVYYAQKPNTISNSSLLSEVVSKLRDIEVTAIPKRPNVIQNLFAFFMRPKIIISFLGKNIGATLFLLPPLCLIFAKIIPVIVGDESIASLIEPFLNAIRLIYVEVFVLCAASFLTNLVKAKT